MTAPSLTPAASRLVEAVHGGQAGGHAVTDVTAAMAEYAGRCAFHDYFTVADADPELVPPIVPVHLADAFRAGFEAERATRWPEGRAPVVGLSQDEALP